MRGRGRCALERVERRHAQEQAHVGRAGASRCDPGVEDEERILARHSGRHVETSQKLRRPRPGEPHDRARELGEAHARAPGLHALERVVRDRIAGGVGARGPAVVEIDLAEAIGLAGEQHADAADACPESLRLEPHVRREVGNEPGAAVVVAQAAVIAEQRRVRPGARIAAPEHGVAGAASPRGPDRRIEIEHGLRPRGRCSQGCEQRERPQRRRRAREAQEVRAGPGFRTSKRRWPPADAWAVSSLHRSNLLAPRSVTIPAS